MSSLDNIAAKVDLDRLPDNIRSFISAQYGSSESNKMEETKAEKNQQEALGPSEGKKPVAAKKIKHTPKPPAGPPPPEALSQPTAAKS